MSEYQQRVIDEQVQLEERFRKIKAFLLTDAFLGLSAEEQYLLKRQCHTMADYVQILGERIKLFK